MSLNTLCATTEECRFLRDWSLGRKVYADTPGSPDSGAGDGAMAISTAPPILRRPRGWPQAWRMVGLVWHVARYWQTSVAHAGTGIPRPI